MTLASRSWCDCRRSWLICPLLLLALADANLSADAQTAPSTALPDAPSATLPRYELGLNVADIRTLCVGNSGCFYPSWATGVGGSINLNQNVALISEANVTATSSSSSTNVAGGRLAEYLVGVRGELRASHYGYFLQGEPGLITWNHAVSVSTPPVITPHSYQFAYTYRYHFVTNIGGGMEYSPSPRVHVRVAVGDLLTSYTLCCWYNNLQSTVGVYTGFGKPLSWRAPTYDSRTAHPFFDIPNVLLITGSVAAMTADSVTTQRFLAHGIPEGNPFVRPLVKYGWSGQLSVQAVETGGDILVMYGLHRIHHHRIERLVPVGVAASHAAFAYHNTQLKSQPSHTP